MFVKEINNITLVNEVADRLFDNITGASYAHDKTFTATLRAVLHDRLPENETVNIALIPIGFGLNAIRYTSADVVLKEVSDRVEQNNLIHNYTISVIYPQEPHIGDQLLDYVRVNVGEGKKYFNTHAHQEDLRIFFIKKLTGLFYTNRFGSIIFLDRLDIRRFHTLQMMIPKYLLSLFDDNPLSNDEVALLKSLGARSPFEYETLIEQFAQKLDMRTEMIKTRLKGFETVFERERVREITNLLESYRDDYQRCLDDLNRTASLIRDQEIILAGLESIIDDNNQSELLDYFLCNKNLSIIRVNGTELEFVVHGYADSYDEDALDTYVNNPKSYLYNYSITNCTADAMKRFYHAIFSDRAYKLRICAAYRADMSSRIYAIKQYIYPPECQTYIPNPHIHTHGCIGSFSPRFTEYLKNRDYAGAVDLAAVSARNLNFHDSGVISKFIKTLSGTPIKCIEDKDGNLMTPRQLIKNLEEVS